MRCSWQMPQSSQHRAIKLNLINPKSAEACMWTHVFLTTYPVPAASRILLTGGNTHEPREEVPAVPPAYAVTTHPVRSCSSACVKPSNYRRLIRQLFFYSLTLDDQTPCLGTFVNTQCRFGFPARKKLDLCPTLPLCLCQVPTAWPSSHRCWLNIFFPASWCWVILLPVGVIGIR